MILGYFGPKSEGAGIWEYVDINDFQNLEEVVEKYQIDTIFNLAAILSVQAELNPALAWKVGVDGLLNCLEIARKYKCQVFTPSSIAAFGSSTPLDNTPQITIQRPTTIYGITKVTGELLSDYYFYKYGVDTRSLRFPGIISYKTKPGGGTTDYAIEMIIAAKEGKTYNCPLSKDTRLDMMYMPDAIDATNAKSENLKHRNSYNLAATAFTPNELYMSIKRHFPDFKTSYNIDKLKQSIANSWPNNMDDSEARKDWGWQEKWGLNKMVDDMIKNLKI